MSASPTIRLPVGTSTWNILAATDRVCGILYWGVLLKSVKKV